MRCIARYILSVAALLTTLPGAAADEPGFVSLFDGKTLDGWTVNCLPKDKELARAAWTVDNGTLLANTVGHEEHFYILLATKKGRLPVLAASQGVQVMVRSMPRLH